MVKFLDLNSQYESIKGEIDDAISNVIAEANFIGGKFVKNFEEQFAKFCGSKYCVGVGNGTDALEIAIESLNLPAGSEIIVPANSFIASSEAVTRSGHKVVFADIDPRNYVLTAKTVESKLTTRSSAIIAVHLYGHPCDMVGLKELAVMHNLKIIEDCAQAHGAEYNGKRVGNLGDVAAFSFYPGKNLGAYGDAGAITTNVESLAIRARQIANHGRIAKYDHEMEGRNSRLDGLQASILSAKLKHLISWTEQRIKIADYYLSSLKDIPELVLPLRESWAKQVYHLFVVRTNHRDQLRLFLANQGIETGIHYPTALPKLDAYKHLSQNTNEFFACQIDSTLLSLPIGEHITLKCAEKVVKSIKEYFANNSNLLI